MSFGCWTAEWSSGSPLRAGPQQALLWASFQTYFLLLQFSDTFCVGTSGVAFKVQKGGGHVVTAGLGSLGLKGCAPKTMALFVTSLLVVQAVF